MAFTYKRIEMVGRLEKDKETGAARVFINSREEIQYKVKSFSINNGVRDEAFSGYIDSINNLEFDDDRYAKEEDRVAAFSNFYSKSLFIFSHKTDSAGNVNIDGADIISCPPHISDDSTFVAVPCFSSRIDCDVVKNVQLNRIYSGYSQFRQLLLEEGDLGKVYNYKINLSTDFPEFVIWADTSKLCAIGPIKEAMYSSKDGLVLKIDPESFCEIDLEEAGEDITKYMIQSESNPTVIHIESKKYFDIVDKMTQRIVEIQSVHVPQHTSAETVFAPASNDKKDVTSDVVSTTDLNQPSVQIRELPVEQTERAILEFFRYHSQRNKLFYDPKDIVNFHTAIKTGSLVILSGMSGTGKSALVDTYARALGIEKNVLVIPVRPSWNDDSDLLGYVDLIHMVYRPSDTGFINKIVEASQPENKDKLYIICLDEMNLSRVEHYFSQFLSILEKPEGSRELVLYDEQYSGQLYNSSKYPQTISIGNNIKFVGTVNIDESTYHFSDKVLDRANVITLEILNYSDPKNWQVDTYKAANTPVWTNELFRKLIKADNVDIENGDRIREFLWRMHVQLHEMNASLGVGPRIVKSIEKYLRNLPESDGEYSLTLQEGLDYQVAQRILTKIRGPEDQLEELFQKNESGCSVLVSLLDSFSDISKFVRCRKAIAQKEKELRVYGYCL